MNTIYFVRHAENPANLTREFSHHNVDYSLTPRGVIQAQQTAAYFADKGIDAIYSSPLKRARETAEIIGEALGLPVTVLEQFREVNTGTLEDAPPTPEAWALHDGIIGEWTHGKPESQFPGGEDYFSMRARTRAGLVAVLAGKTGRRIVIVAHGGTIATTLREFCSPVDNPPFNIPIGNCAVSRFEFALDNGEPQGRLCDWASCAHLSGAALTAAPARPVGA